MQDDDEAFKAFERGVRARSVLDVERERVIRGHPADFALQKHGADLEAEVLRGMDREAEAPHSSHGSAEILGFVAAKKPDGE